MRSDYDKEYPDLAEEIANEAAAEQARFANDDANCPGADAPLPEKKPLRRKVKDPAEFPIKAFGEELAEIARAIHSIVRAPLVACVLMMLGAMNTVVQGLADLVLPHGRRPLSLFMLCIMESGERKTAIFNLVFAALRAYERELRIEWERQMRIIENDPERKGEFIPLPTIVVSESTIDGLMKLVGMSRGYVVNASDEAAVFTQSHSMGSKDVVRAAAVYSGLWDATPQFMARAAADNRVIDGKRVSICLMAQPAAVSPFMSNSQIQSQGLTARFLFAWPMSMIGTRKYEAPSAAALEAVAAFSRKVDRLVRRPLPLVPQTKNILDPRDLVLTEKAMQRYIDFHDEIESQCGEGGKYYPIRETAAKSPEQALRIAGTLALFAVPTQSKLIESRVEQGVTLARYFLNEALRIASNEGDADLILAEKTLAWIVAQAKKTGSDVIGLTLLYRNGPTDIRQAAKARKIAGILVSHGYLAPIKGGEMIGGKKCEAYRIL